MSEEKTEIKREEKAGIVQENPVIKGKMSRQSLMQKLRKGEEEKL